MKFAANNVRWFVLALVLVGALALSGAWFLRGQAQAELPEVPQGSGMLSPDASAFHTCTVVEIAAFEDRIHVRCTTAPSSAPAVFFFAASTLPANSQNANRFLTLLNTALALNKTVYLWYDTSSSANPSGCSTGDCRKIVALYIKQ